MIDPESSESFDCRVHGHNSRVLAVEELEDIRGLSLVKGILEKHEVLRAIIDFKGFVVIQSSGGAGYKDEAIEEIKKVKGFSDALKVLEKYNLTQFSIDSKLRIVVRYNKTHNPKKAK